MRKILIIGILFMATTVYGQTKDEPFSTLTDQEAIERIDHIPTVNGQIKYDEIIEAPGQSSKEIFIKIRNWFVEKFKDSKYVLKVNDEDNGLLTGKGTYRYKKVNGINKHVGFVHFILNVKTKDGKFRYQVYSYEYEGYGTGLMGSAATGRSEVVDMDDVLKDYKNGKRLKRGRHFLSDIVKLQDYMSKSLKYNVLKKDDISDF